MADPLIYVDSATAGISIADPEPSISVLWDQAVQAAVIAEKTGPTIASRAYAIVHTSIFEAWAAYDPIGIGTAWGDALQVDASNITDANKAEAMSYAAYVALVDLFPEQVQIFDSLMEELGFTTDLSSVTAEAAQLGITAGQGVMAAFSADGSNQAGGYADTSDYKPGNANPGEVTDIARWTPEYVPIDSGNADSLQSFLTPHWGEVHGFALPATDALRPEAPEPFFQPAWIATLDMETKTITISGLGATATKADIQALKEFLLHSYDGDISRGAIERFCQGALKALAGKGNHDPSDLKQSLVLDISKDLIGPIINPGFISQAEAIVAANANLTTETKVIAEFWEDGGGTSFPPGTWMSFAEYVSARDDNTLDEDAQLFFMMSNAVFDAGIATWEAKAHYDYARPVAVIRDLGELGLIGEWGTDYLGNEGHVIEAYAGAGLGTQTILATDFITYQNPYGHPSPPFAEYTSGHSSFSAAGAEILSRFTGSDVFGAEVEIDVLIFEGLEDLEASVLLSWETFEDAALEAGMSRIYGGIHFDDGNLNGIALGEEIGGLVYDEAMTFIDGTATDFHFV